MPFYEFYCEHCHRILNFFSRSVNTDKQPSCPICHQPNLQRIISTFNALKDTHSLRDKKFSNPNDPEVLQAQAFLNTEMSKINSSDPKQVATVLKKLGDMTGNYLGSELQHVLTQIEKGGDINELQSKMENILSKYEENSETEFGIHKEKVHIPPTFDTEIYEL